MVSGVRVRGFGYDMMKFAGEQQHHVFVIGLSVTDGTGNAFIMVVFFSSQSQHNAEGEKGSDILMSFNDNILQTC